MQCSLIYIKIEPIVPKQKSGNNYCVPSSLSLKSLLLSTFITLNTARQSVKQQQQVKVVCRIKTISKHETQKMYSIGHNLEMSINMPTFHDTTR